MELNCNKVFSGHCEKYDLCMWQMSTRFCRPPYCNSPKAPYDHCMYSCPDTRMKNYESELRLDCEQSKGVAIKSIRYHDLIHLEPLLEEGKFDFKIIVLTRDPRAIYASRTEIYSDESHRWQLLHDLEQECRDTYSRFSTFIKAIIEINFLVLDISSLEKDWKNIKKIFSMFDSKMALLIPTNSNKDY